MFWEYGITTSNIDQLLDSSEPPDLETILSEPDFVQETRVHNEKLMNFLCQEDQVTKLLDILTSEPSTDMDERIRFRFPNVICELMTANHAYLDNSVFEDHNNVDKLWRILKEPSINNYLTFCFVLKVITHYVTFHSENMVSFLKAKEPDFVHHILQHIESTFVSDLIMRMLCASSDNSRKFFQAKFSEVDASDILLDCFSSKTDPQRAQGAMHIIIELIRCVRITNDQDDHNRFETQFLARLNSDHFLNKLVTYIYEAHLQKCQEIFVSSASVLCAIFNLQRIGHFHGEEFCPPTVLTSFALIGTKSDLSNFVINIEPLLNILKSDSDSHWPSPSEDVWSNLGRGNLLVAEALVSLVLYRNSEIENEFIRLNVLSVFLNMFEKYYNNNFLHSHVLFLISSIIDGSSWRCIGVESRFPPSDKLLINLLENPDFIPLILSISNGNRPNSAHGKEILRCLQKCQKSGMYKDLITAKMNTLETSTLSLLNDTLTLISKLDEIEAIDKRILLSTSMNLNLCMENESLIPESLSSGLSMNFLSIEKGVLQIKMAKSQFSYDDEVENFESNFEMDIDTSLEKENFTSMDIMMNPPNFSFEAHESIESIIEENILTVDETVDSAVLSEGEFIDNEIRESQNSIKIKDSNTEAVQITVDLVSRSHSNDDTFIEENKQDKRCKSESERSGNCSLNVLQPNSHTRNATSSPLATDIDGSIDNNDAFESDDSNVSPIECSEN